MVSNVYTKTFCIVYQIYNDDDDDNGNIVLLKKYNTRHLELAISQYTINPLQYV